MKKALRWSGVDYRQLLKDDQPDGTPSDRFGRERYLAQLRTRAPNQWISDHLTESQRLKGAVYLAIRCLGDMASKAKVTVSRWHPEARMGGDQEAKEPLPYDHDIVRLLRIPNRHQTFGMMLKRGVQQVSLTGTSLFWNVTDGTRKPIELWSVPTASYQPIAPNPWYPDGGYRILPWFPGPLSMVPGIMSAGGVAVGAEHMIATRHPHPLIEHEGLSPLAACDLALDTIDSIDRARDATMRRLVKPSATLETDPQFWDPDGNSLEVAREELRQLLYGADKAGGVAALPPGSRLVSYEGGNVEIGWIESWSQLIGFVLSIFGVTKALAFMDDETSFAQLYASIRQHNLFTMCPLLQLFADTINLQCVWPFWGEEYFVELEPEKITDEEHEKERVQIAGGFSAITNNEARMVLGFPKTEEKWGEERVGKAEMDALLARSQEPAKQGTPAEERKEDAETTRARPKNPQGRGSLGNRLILNGARNGKH